MRAEAALAARVHLTGIGGVGMSALASMLLRRGHTVTGSDRHASATTARLKAEGATIRVGHGPLPPTDWVIRSPAVDLENVECAEAAARGLPVLTRAEALGRLTARYEMIVGVAGTHGKTTTTAMLATMVIAANADPTVVLGGNMLGGNNFREGRGPACLFEACEGYGALQSTPVDVACLLNIDDDHVEQFGAFDSIIQSFRAWVAASPEALVNGDDPVVRGLNLEQARGVYTFGQNPDCDLRAENLRFESGGSRFDLRLPDGTVVPVKVPCPGSHNAYNALAALATAWRMGISVAHSARALQSFPGVERRLEDVGTWRGARIVNDYAHHPTAVHAALSAMREPGSAGRLVAAFQPHLFSRTKRLARRFAEALLSAEVVLLFDVDGAREPFSPTVTVEAIAQPLRDLGHPAVFTIGPIASAEEVLGEILRPGDCLVILGAGEIGRLGRMLVGDRRLEARGAF